MGNGNGTALVKANKKALVELLQKNEPRLNNLLPKYMTPERVMSLVMMATRQTPKLLEASPESTIHAVMQSAQLGLEIGRTAHLVPFYNKRTNQLETQFIPDFKGLIQLAVESGSVLSVDPWLVYEGEHFKVRGGTNRGIDHEPDPTVDRSDESIRAVYVIFDLPNGLTRFHWMSRQEVDEVKAVSKASSGPWVDWYGQMAIKTCIKRGLKTLPGDPTAADRLARALEMDNRFETGRINVPIPEWDDEDQVADAATQARKEELKARLMEKGRELEQEEEAGDGDGAMEPEPEATGASEPPPADPSDYDRAKGRYFAVAGEIFDTDDQRKAWQSRAMEKPSAAHWSTEDFIKATDKLQDEDAERRALAGRGPEEENPLEEPKGDMPWEEEGGLPL